MKIASIYIRNVLSFKDTFVRRGEERKVEAIPLGETVTTIAGKNNAGKTNFLRCIDWVYRGIFKPMACTYDGTSTYELTGLFVFEGEKDLKRFFQGDPNIQPFIHLAAWLGELLGLYEKRSDIKNLRGGEHVLSAAGQSCDNMLNHLTMMQQNTHAVYAEEVDSNYCQITHIGSSRVSVFLSPFKKCALDMIKDILPIVGEEERIYNHTRQKIYKQEDTVTYKLGRVNSMLMKTDFRFGFNQAIDADIERCFFRIKFIDQDKNMPINASIPVSSPIGRDIEKFIVGMSIRENPGAATNALNKNVKDMLRRHGFPIFEDMDLSFNASGDDIKMNIQNIRTRDTYTVEQLSFGIRWLLSLWLQIYAERSTMPDLLMIDEPGHNAHPGAQKEIMQRLGELADKQGIQIVYTAHSPFMIDPNRILDIRLIDLVYDAAELKEYSVCDIKPYLKHFEPLHTALGLRFVKPYLLLEKSEHFCMCEGESDGIIIMALSQLCSFHKLPFLDLNKTVIYPVGGATKQDMLKAIDNIRLSSYKSIVIVVDGDCLGNEAKAEIERRYGPSDLKNHRILCMSIPDVVNIRGCSIEDIIPNTDYIEAFSSFYNSFNHEWGKIDVGSCLDHPDSPIVQNLIDCIEKMQKVERGSISLNKTGIARKLIDILFGKYGEHKHEDIVLRELSRGIALISKLAKMESTIAASK